VDPRGSLDDLEKKKFFTLPGLDLRPLGRPVAIPTELSRLLEICTVSNIGIYSSSDKVGVVYLL
jgi:hypothetical protein